MAEQRQVELTPEQEVIAAFSAEIEDTAKITNPPAITECIYFWPGPTPDDDELPAPEVYDEHAEAMKRLVDEGVLQTGAYLGITVYGLVWA